jgi:hypothetical protein
MGSGSCIAVQQLRLQWNSRTRLYDARRAINMLQTSLGADALSAHIGRAYFQLGRALDAQGKKDEAPAAFRTAAEDLEKTLGQDHAEARGARQLAGLKP